MCHDEDERQLHHVDRKERRANSVTVRSRPERTIVAVAVAVDLCADDLMMYIRTKTLQQQQQAQPATIITITTGTFSPHRDDFVRCD